MTYAILGPVIWIFLTRCFELTAKTLSDSALEIRETDNVTISRRFPLPVRDVLRDKSGPRSLLHGELKAEAVRSLIYSTKDK